MKYFFRLCIFFNTLLFAQPTEKKDSIAYYSSLSNSYVQDNNYKEALLNTQKAIFYAKKNKNVKDLAYQNFYLGRLYYDLKKYNDAVESLLKRSDLYANLKPSAYQADTYYYLGLANLGTGNYDRASLYFNKTKSIYTPLKIPDTAELFALQTGLIYKSKNKLDLALTVFKTIIAKSDSPELSNTKAEALYQPGNIEALRSRNNLALNYLNKALHLNSKTENLEQKSNVLLALIAVYEKYWIKTMPIYI